MRNVSCRLVLFLLCVPPFILHEAAAQSECPANAHVDRVEMHDNLRTTYCKCDSGYESRGGACRAMVSDAQCVRRAGEQLRADQQQGCARTLGRCFEDNKTPLSVSALACVVACRQGASCAVGCGIGALAAEQIIEKCVDERNSCFAAALTRHQAAVKACKSP